MDIHYLHVAEHVKNTMLTVKQCPTEDILADYFTKPFQGSLFVKLQNFIMGAKYAHGDQQSPRSVLDDEDQHSEACMNSEVHMDFGSE